MRIFRDLDLAEELGSGVPRILETYSGGCFTFSDNFLRIVFPSPEMDYSEGTPQVDRLVEALEGEKAGTKYHVVRSYKIWGNVN